MKTLTRYALLGVMLVISSCSKKEKTSSTYQNGELTVLTDESFKSVTEALADGYTISYPEAKIKVQTMKEDLALLEILNNRAKVAVMSRELTPEEIKVYEKNVELEYTPARFAADAVVFIVPKNSTKTSISMEEIAKGMESENKTFIFDGVNSSNLNFVAQKLNKQPKDLKFSIIPGNVNVIEELNKYPSKIGVIGLNTISRPYDKEAEKLRDLIKVLPVEVDGKLYNTDFEGLREMKYPFTRVLYFLTNESGYNMAGGFVRYSCTDIGQKIVQKEGLQQYNLYGRRVQMR